MTGQYEDTSSGPSFAVRVLRELFAPANAKDAKRPIRRWIRKLAFSGCFVLFVAILTFLATGLAISERFALPSLSKGNPEQVWSFPIQRAESLLIGYYRGQLTLYLSHEIPYDYDGFITYRSLPGILVTHDLNNPFVELPPPAPRSACLCLFISDWWLLSFFGLPPICAFVAGPLRRALRTKPGHCRKCGYCLTGLVEPRCPECGTMFLGSRSKSEVG